MRASPTRNAANEEEDRDENDEITHDKSPFLDRNLETKLLPFTVPKPHDQTYGLKGDRDFTLVLGRWQGILETSKSLFSFAASNWLIVCGS